MSDVVTFSRALADPTRWRILRLVREEALCVCELADILGMPQSSVSSHVQIIRKAGLLESEKCEKWTYFRVESQYLKILDNLEALFGGQQEDDESSQDRAKMQQRLSVRRDSCCPGPRALLARKRPTPKSLTP